MQKGALKIDLISRGKAAHSGYPHMGKSAIDPLLDVLSELRKEQWPNDADLGANFTANV
jgi:acetylornithine deacetylase